MKTIHPQYKARLFQVINESAFPRHIEMKIVDIDIGSSRFVMEARPFRMQPFQVAAGGNAATLIDSAAFWACFLAMESDEDGMTSIDLKINYLAPVFDEPLTCTGRMKKLGKKVFYAEAEVHGKEGRLVAHGTSTILRLPGRGLRLGLPMFLGI